MGIIHDQYFNSASPPARLRGGLTWLKYSRYLTHLINQFRRCTVVSERERDVLLQNIRGNFQVEIVPNCIDLASYVNIHEQPQPDTLISTGSLTYRPNYDAVCWFLENVFPQLRLRIPGLRLAITGERANLPLPAADGVWLTGMIDDVRPWIARAWVSIVPLQTGGGTRLKVLESMALGTPVVATSKGAEGLDVVSGEHLLIADDPRQFADHVVRLLHDPALRERLAGRARDLIARCYDWAVVGPRFAALIEDVGRRAGPVPPPWRCPWRQ